MLFGCERFWVIEESLQSLLSLLGGIETLVVQQRIQRRLIHERSVPYVQIICKLKIIGRRR